MVNNVDKVVIGMSGGVDSSVAALILKEKGYEVIGVTLYVWQKDNESCAEQAVLDAKNVCDKIGIEHRVIQYADKFKEHVIDKFATLYIEGKTPNPCNICNRYVKFEGLLSYALSIGADYIATGHYANVERDFDTGRYYIKKSISDKKDQTYALYSLTQEQLSHLILPLGDFSKDEIREIARKNGLLNADKKDSQEICFVPDKDYAKYIYTNYGYVVPKGKFVDRNGNVYGEHKGIIHYTVGQRKGLGLSLKQPMYVTKIDTNSNCVVIGGEEELKRDTLECTEVNFMSISSLDVPMRVKAKIRYNAVLADATIRPLDSGNVKVMFDIPVKGVAPGQAVVFYDNDRLIGGGIII